MKKMMVFLTVFCSIFFGSLLRAQEICLLQNEEVLTLGVALPVNLKSNKSQLLGTWELPRRPGDSVTIDAYIKVYYQFKTDIGPVLQVLFDYRNQYDFGLPYTFQGAVLIQERAKSLEYALKDFQKGSCENVGRSIFPGQYFSETFPISLEGNTGKYMLKIWGSQN